MFHYLPVLFIIIITHFQILSVSCTRVPQLCLCVLVKSEDVPSLRLSLFGHFRILGIFQSLPSHLVCWCFPAVILICIVINSSLLHCITCNLADGFIQSDLQLIRLSRRHTPWSNVGLRALLKGPTVVQILLWPRLGSNHRPCRSESSSLTN